MSFLDFLIVSGLLFANAFFVAAEFALVKVRTSQIEHLAERGHWAAKITSRLIDRLDAYLSASQLGITLASLGLGWAIHDSVEPFIKSVLHAVGLSGSVLVAGTTLMIVPTIAFLFVTFLHIALGELVPKSLAIRAARVVALWTAPPLMAFYYLFFPIIWILNKASDLVLLVLGLGSSSHAELVHTEEELRHILGESAAGGFLSRNERVMIENVLNLEEKTARRVMVPRPDVVYLSLSRPVEDNLRLARQAGHTRYPLCQDDLTTVMGMVHVKDLFRAGAGVNGRPDLTKLARPIPTLPDTLHLDRLLLEFQRQRVHVAMLADERGAIVGMVTLENVLEELVGPIQDEFDRERPTVVAVGEGVFEIDAMCPLDVLADTCDVEVPETDAETAAGLVLEQLGRLARVGDHIEVGRHRLTVIQADPTRIRRLRIEPAPPAAEADSPEESRPG
jgi:CBS domain containing-hemolysin-like protein